jgi:hypothetical protein
VRLRRPKDNPLAEADAAAAGAEGRRGAGDILTVRDAPRQSA